MRSCCAPPPYKFINIIMPSTQKNTASVDIPLPMPSNRLRTTKPQGIRFPSEPFPEPIHTNRLILRLFNRFDMGAYHSLASQPAAMDSDGGYSVTYEFTRDRFLCLLPISTSFFSKSLTTVKVIWSVVEEFTS